MPDLNVPDLLQAADKARAMWPGCQLWLTWTCNECKRRITLTDPDTFPEFVVCLDCGHKQRFERGGFTVTWIV